MDLTPAPPLAAKEGTNLTPRPSPSVPGEGKTGGRPLSLGEGNERGPFAAPTASSPSPARLERGLGGEARSSLLAHQDRWGRARFVPLLLLFLAALSIAVGILVVGIRPAWRDVVLLTAYLAVSGSLSLALGSAGLMALEKRGIGGLTLRIAFGQLIVILVALVNVGATAWLMFLSPHDFTLLGSLLAFAAAMALFMSLALARSIAAAVGGVTAAARRMAAGDLSARAPRVSQDELGELASAFNLMADALEMAAERQQSAENARREVVAAISHDLRTPLASIRAMVEAINDGVVADAETIQRYLRTTQNETERLGQLIDDLFELSQLDAGALQPQLEMGSLHDLISDTLGSLEIQAEKHGVRLVASVDPGIGPARFDSRRIQRVLDNLVGNAIRHTPAGGQVELSAAAVNGDIKVTVRDTGEGIAPEEQDRIFERFYRGEKSRARDGAGAGLGLTIARGIVHAHGGRIWLESKPGQGTAFFFTLPRMNSIERE